MPVSQDAVKWAFRLLLGRDISLQHNSDKLIESFCRFDDEHALAEAFIKCEEFRTAKRFSPYIKILEPQDVKKLTLNKEFDPKATIKFSLFGNCQVTNIGKVIEASHPGAEALSYCLGIDNFHDRINSPDLSQAISDSDIIVVQFQNISDIISKKHPESRSRIRLIPNIPFNGFHPDNDYINNLSGERITSGPLGGAHSILTAWCWNHGMSVSSALELFCDEVFSHLGYYSCMESSRNNLLKVGRAVDYPISEMMMKWFSTGCFMHTINHPKINVLGDLAQEILRKEGIAPILKVEDYIHDDLADYVCWPVYPEIANKHQITGGYNFKKHGIYPAMINLDEFVSASFDNYNKLEKGSLQSPRFHEEGFQTLEQLVKKRGKQRHSVSLDNPYKSLPDHCFWKRAVTTVVRDSVDPIVSPRFGVMKGELVATAGSCFAQHIAKRLAAEGFNYYVPEDGKTLSEEERKDRNYGVFSCRYGNLYTTRQLVQLFDRSMGRFTPGESAWQRADGRYVDPFRPQIEPGGFKSEEAMEASRREHLACVKEMFEKLDILVFTLGLTESWESMEDGAVFPLAPGVAGGVMDPSRHSFRNLTAKEVADDLELFLLKLQGVNPKARVILTVSPVPLIATYENRHVLVSNTHSKSVLRTVAGEMASRSSQCEYFPSYEIITGQHVGNGYLEEDLRSVRPEGVDHVMRVFLKHYAGKTVSIPIETTQREREQQSAIERINDIICDE